MAPKFLNLEQMQDSVTRTWVDEVLKHRLWTIHSNKISNFYQFSLVKLSVFNSINYVDFRGEEQRSQHFPDAISSYSDQQRGRGLQKTAVYSCYK